MIAKLRRRLTYANVMATVAMFIALGGLAVASIPGSGGAIKACYSKRTGALRVIDSGKSCSSRRERTLRWNQTGPRGLPGIQGSQGAQGPQGTQGPMGTQGVQGLAGSARAFGRVSQSGVISDAKNVIGTQTSGATGTYCITLDPSIDASTAAVIVAPDNHQDDTGPAMNAKESIVEWTSFAGLCAAGANQIAVLTYAYQQNSTSTDSITSANEGFAFVVP